MTLDYFYGQAGELFSFFRILKALFQEQRFQNLSTDAKILYGILLDRMSLSAKKRLAGRAEPGVHYLHDRGCQEGVVLRRQQSDQAAPGTRGHRPRRAQTPWSGPAQPDLRQGFFVWAAKSASTELQKQQFWCCRNRNSGTAKTASK